MSFPAKFAGRCYVCTKRVSEGDMVDLDPETRKVSHEECTPPEKKAAQRARRGYGMGYRGSSDHEQRPTRSMGGSPLGMPVNKPNVAIGGNGPRIGIVAFNKVIASDMQTKLAAGKEFLIGSSEQDAIWDAMMNDDSHLLVNASAGVGKSTTAQQGVLRLIKEKDASAKAMTYHSLGLSILRSHFGKVELDEHKLDGLIDALAKTDKGSKDDDEWYAAARLASQLTRLCKHYLYDGQDKQQLIELADFHNVDYDEEIEDFALSLVPKLLALDMADPQHTDFDGMTWLPVVLGLKANLFDILIVDELQDSSRAQQALAKIVCPNGRIIGLGDKNQSIYGFRSAIGSMERFESMLFNDTSRGCQVLPLTVTRRCPKSHVAVAQSIVGKDVICAMDDAAEGTMEQLSHDKALDNMRPGDMVLCRVNRYLIPVCYELIQRGIKAVVRGRDIGAGLEALIKKLGSPETTDELQGELNEYLRKETARLSARKNADALIGALQDRYETLHELMSGTQRTAEVIGKIRQIFADFEADGTPKNAVILGTVHKLKGIEADNVFILAPELLPHPLARQQWEIEGERCIAYVAITRAKKHITFVGGIPEIYGVSGAAVTKEDVEVEQ